MTDLDQLFGAQQRNLRASFEKAEQDRETQKLADRAAKRTAISAKRRKRKVREQRPERVKESQQRPRSSADDAARRFAR
jgi:hypothetical protein